MGVVTNFGFVINNQYAGLVCSVSYMCRPFKEFKSPNAFNSQITTTITTTALRIFLILRSMGM